MNHFADQVSDRSCWTCRLRKKKCDGNLDRCFTCLRLGLTCDGYAEKPDWFDNKERTVARRKMLKQQVKQNSLPRSRRPIVLQGIDALQLPPASSSRTEHSYGGANSFQRIAYDLLPVGPKSDPSSVGGEAIHLQNQSMLQYRDLNLNLPNPLNNLDPVTPLEQATSTNKLYLGWLQHHAQTTEEIQSFPVSGDDPAMLIMYYLDVVFPIQFPFYRRELIPEGRSWVLMLSRDSVPFYWLILSLSAFHRKHFTTSFTTSTLETGVSDEEAWKAYHTLALREFNQKISELPLPGHFPVARRFKCYAEILACVMQFISLELLDAHSDEASIHMSAGAFYVEMLRECWSIHNDTSLKATTWLPAEYDKGQSPTQLSINLKTSLYFSTATILRFDIMASATFRAASRLATSLDHLFNTDSLNLDLYFGCKASVIQLVGKVSELDAWMADKVANNSLSLTQLVERALPTKQALWVAANVAISATLTSDNTSRSRPRSSSRSMLEGTTSREIDASSAVLALGALVYLEIIISGCYPLIPDIQATVKESIDILETFGSSAEWIGRNSWPFVVLGSMAQGRERNTFRRLASVMKEDQNPAGAPWIAGQVVEEVWRVQATQGLNCDWVGAMKSLACLVPLA